MATVVAGTATPSVAPVSGMTRLWQMLQTQRNRDRQRKQLRPAGHNAFAEWMVGFITPVGSTAMVIIACYVLAQEELGRILGGKGQGSDYFVAGLVFVLGAMVDTAVIVTASRFKMHVARGRREIQWAIITGTMLFLCLGVEAMTLMYFAWLVSPESVPPYVVSTVKHIHDILFFVRNGLPPVIIAFFTTCLMPLSVETSDRDRAAKASSSLNIAALQEDLVAVGDTATPEQKLTALENQIAINEHASQASEDEHKRNIALIDQLRLNYGLPPRSTQNAVAQLTAKLTQEKDQIAQQAQHDRELMEQSHQSAIEKVIADAEQRMAEATRKAEETVNTLMTGFIPMMVDAVVDNVWPEQLLAMTPVFANIKPHTMIQQAGYHVTTTPPSVAQYATLSQPAPQRNPMAPPPATDDDASATAGLRPIAEREPPRTTPPTGASTPAPRRGGSRRKTTTEDNQS